MARVDLAWKQIGDYEIIDLKKAVFLCVDQNDDAITQFEDVDINKQEINK